jgi:hypothetical protein
VPFTESTNDQTVVLIDRPDVKPRQHPTAPRLEARLEIVSVIADLCRVDALRFVSRSRFDQLLLRKNRGGGDG